MPLHARGLCPSLSVFEMPSAIRFYHDMEGFRLVGTSGAVWDNPDHVNWSLLEINGNQLMVNAAYDPDHQTPSPEPARWTGHQHTCVYFSCPVVDRAYDCLESKGVDLQAANVTLQPETAVSHRSRRLGSVPSVEGVTGWQERRV